MTEQARSSRSSLIADQTVDRSQALIMSSPNHLKLGVFGINLSGGTAGVTFAEGPPRIANWDEVLSTALAAELAGLEALVPIGRWKGFGGPSGFWDRSLESFTYAAGLAQATDRIQIFTTCHVGVIHPVMAAKMGATIDHIANGRWGLNIVAGWLGPEFEMFGYDLPPHGKRYEMAIEWLDIVKRLWTETEPFDYDGAFFHLKGAISDPKCVQAPYPVVMNAGHSPAGVDFAASQCDMIYISTLSNSIADDVDRIRETAAKSGRNVSVWGTAHINCRDTQEGDYETAKRYAVQMLAADSSSHDKFRRDSDLMKLIMSTGGNRGILGSPEQVVAELAEISAAGVDGIAMIFTDYNDGITRYTEQMLPLMREAGLRL
jgi:FMNH2-dependent dimethyl sulfone monooxygenase